MTNSPRITDRNTLVWQRLVNATLLAVLSAAVANALIYGIASAIGAMPQTIEVRPGQPITLLAAVGTTISAVVSASVMLALLIRFTSRPYTIFLAVAAIVLVLSFATPFTLPKAPLLMVIVLEVMHVITAVITVYVLTKLQRPS